MGKIKEELKRKKKQSKKGCTIKTLKEEVIKKIYQEKVDIAKCLLEQKYREIEEAQQIVEKLKSQIEEIENTDIRDIQVEHFEY